MKQQEFRQLLVWLIQKPKKTKTRLPSLLLLLFAFATTNAFGQIPDNGFETWGIYTDFAPPHIAYANPNGWYGALGTNPADTAYSIHKNPDNFPSGTGSYSIIVKADIGKGVIGLARTGNQTQLVPAFAITGHPTSLTGYYKFLPLNGDTMTISVALFQTGALVAGGSLTGTATTTNWSSFNVPISSYTAADSAFISLASCNSNGRPPVQQGNSTLYIDNLNFDVLITAVISEGKGLPMHFSLDQNYPNPFNPSTTINYGLPTASRVRLIVYNILGQIVADIVNTEQAAGWNQVVWNANVASGLYFYRLEAVSTNDQGKRFADVKKMLLLK
jgi:hypothetical protein